jgi:hypothetical protein
MRTAAPLIPIFSSSIHRARSLILKKASQASTSFFSCIYTHHHHDDFHTRLCR